MARAVADEGQDHGERREALQTVVQFVDAVLQPGDRDHSEIETFREIIVIAVRIACADLEVDQELRHLRQAPDETAAIWRRPEAGAAGKQRANADDISSLHDGSFPERYAPPSPEN